MPPKASQTIDRRVPARATTLAEAGLPVDLIVAVDLKTLHFAGELHGGGLAARLGLQYLVIEPVLQHLEERIPRRYLRRRADWRAGFLYRLTVDGRSRAMQYLEQSQYVGHAPVPLATYEAYMRAFATAAPKTATRERVRQAFSKLVLSQRVSINWPGRERRPLDIRVRSAG